MGLLAVIELSFDPALQLGDLLIRWQTIGLTVALLAGLGLAVRIDGYLVDGRSGRHALRLDDLVYIVLGVVPGTVVGGRIVHGLAFWSAYSPDPTRLLDSSVGSLSLTGALLGGTATGIYVAHLIGAPVRRWADAIAAPLLLAIGLGKLAQLLGGSGQGAPWDGPWAIAFGGVGPWVSPSPGLPAHPAQVYEGIWLLLGLPVIVMLLTQAVVGGGIRDRLRAAQGSGQLFIGVIVWFLLGRVVVGFTWRDDPIVGPLNTEQAVALVLLALIGVGLLIRRRSIVWS